MRSINNAPFNSLLSLNETFIAERFLIRLIRVCFTQPTEIDEKNPAFGGCFSLAISPFPPFLAKPKNGWFTVFRSGSARKTGRGGRRAYGVPRRNLNGIFPRSFITVAGGYRPRPCMNFTGMDSFPDGKTRPSDRPAEAICVNRE